jgi:hypothetical protein
MRGRASAVSVPTTAWYNGNIAFSSVQAGLSIPLPGGAQQSALRAAQTGIELAGSRQERSAQELRLLEQEALQQLERSRKALQTYQESILPSAAKAAAAAEWQWRQGSIRFAEWSMLQQQWLRAAAAALDHTAAINQAILQLHYLYSIFRPMKNQLNQTYIRRSLFRRRCWHRHLGVLYSSSLPLANPRPTSNPLLKLPRPTAFGA